MDELLVSKETETGLTVRSERPHPKEECAFTLVTGHNPTLPLKENNLNDRNSTIDTCSESSHPSSQPVLVLITPTTSFDHIDPHKLPHLSPRNHIVSEMGNPSTDTDMKEESILNSSTNTPRRNSSNVVLTSGQPQSYRRASTTGIEPILGSPRSPLIYTAVPSLSPRLKDDRFISHHALERLGVDMEIVKKEKGMKKLGISDVDIEQSEQIQRYSGVVSLKVTGTAATKAEMIFGFTNEQLSREKAMIVLGTSEEEILDTYARKLSSLGAETLPIL